MQKTIDAIYENGVLRPVHPLDWLDEHRAVRVTVTVPPRANPLSGWVGGMSDEDARQMRHTIAAEFETVKADEWK